MTLAFKILLTIIVSAFAGAGCMKAEEDRDVWFLVGAAVVQFFAIGIWIFL